MPSSSGRRFHRYVAIGDSFTEGVGDHDPLRPNGVRDWADRVADALASHSDDFGYANLAIRGRKMAAILAEQLQPALDLEPDLVTSYAGGNDILRPKVDIDALVRDYDGAIAQPRSTGAEVVLFTAFDLAPLPEMDRRQRRHADLAWGRAHARPWVRRRLSGTSSGDGLQVRRPRLGPLHRVG